MSKKAETMHYPSLPGDPVTNLPLAVRGLTSYRCMGTYGWIMIGARNNTDAMREARRSCKFANREDLEVWKNGKYEKAVKS